MSVKNRLLSLVSARNKEFYRDRSALGWNFIFPLLLIIGMAYAFNGRKPEYKVAYLAQENIDFRAHPFFATQYIDFVAVTDAPAAVEKLKQFKYDLLIAPHTYWVNTTSPKAYFLEKVFLASWRPNDSFERHELKGEGYRYVDWVLPGVLGMNLMFSALFGVGYSIVRYRKTGVLKRLKATPLRAWEFLVAQIVSRLLLIIGTSAILLIGAGLTVGFMMKGSYLDLFLLTIVGVFALIALGLMVAARFRSEEVASGMLNLLSWPMMFLSGVWFSLEGAHPALRRLALIFPLTHLIEGARRIMLEGANLHDLGGTFLVLALMSVVFVALGSFWFRWE